MDSIVHAYTFQYSRFDVFIQYNNPKLLIVSEYFRITYIYSNKHFFLYTIQDTLLIIRI